MRAIPSKFAIRALVTATCLAFVRESIAQNLPSPSYYDSAIGKSGNTLKATLHEIVKGHTVLPYTSTATDTWDALKVLDEDPANAANVILIYSGLTNLKTNQYGGGVGAGKWDREHLLPQSYGLIVLSANSRAKTDLFNLRAIDYTANSTRGNLFYDVTTTPYRTTASAPGSSYDTDSWEPRDEDKGVVARAAFYMATRYDGADADVPDLELSDSPDPATYHFGKLTTLLLWNRLHPPADGERERNQLIFANYQHNRNPFIDEPEYADMVFLGATPEQAWKSLRFTAAELLNPAISGDAADADGDGLATLLEYEFNSDPRWPNSAPSITANTVVVGNSRYIDLNFPHNRNATDVAVSYEGSSDFATWTPTPGQLIASSVTDFETDQWRVRIAAPTAPYFVRIRISKP